MTDTKDQYYYLPLRVSKLAEAATFPVYGIIGKPLDLSVRSICWGSAGYQIISVSFTFSNSPHIDGYNNFEIASFDAKERSIIHNPYGSSENAARRLRSDLYERYRLNDGPQEREPRIAKGEFAIAGVSFTGEVLHWSQPHQLSMFLLRNRETVLSGNALGPSYEELFLLLDSIEVINHREDVLSQYQHELDSALLFQSLHSNTPSII